MIDKEHLQDILKQTGNLTHMEYDKAERLKKKAASAFLVLFGSGFGVERINFTSNFGFANQDVDRQTFYRAKNELESLLEARISDIDKRELEILEKNRPINASSVAVAGDTDKKGEKPALLEQIRDLRAELKLNNEKLIKAIGDNEELKKRIGLAKRFRIIKELTIAFGLVGAGFTAGGFSIGVKIDYDKRQLQQKIDKQKDSLILLKNELQK